MKKMSPTRPGINRAGGRKKKEGGGEESRTMSGGPGLESET